MALSDTRPLRYAGLSGLGGLSGRPGAIGGYAGGGQGARPEARPSTGFSSFYDSEMGMPQGAIGSQPSPLNPTQPSQGSDHDTRMRGEVSSNSPFGSSTRAQPHQQALGHGQQLPPGSGSRGHRIQSLASSWQTAPPIFPKGQEGLESPASARGTAPSSSELLQRMEEARRRQDQPAQGLSSGDLAHMRDTVTAMSEGAQGLQTWAAAAAAIRVLPAQLQLRECACECPRD